MAYVNLYLVQDVAATRGSNWYGDPDQFLNDLAVAKAVQHAPKDNLVSKQLREHQIRKRQEELKRKAQLALEAAEKRRLIRESKEARRIRKQAKGR